MHSDAIDPLVGLDPAQRAAVVVPGSLVITAAPGSGKTRVLTARLAHLARTGAVRIDACVVVTFTRSAGEELRSRLRGMGAALSRDAVGTLHSVLLTRLRAAGCLDADEIIDEAQAASLLDDPELAETLPRGFDLRLFFRALARQRATRTQSAGALAAMRAVRSQSTELDAEAFGRLAERYRAAKSEGRVADFDDILERGVAWLRAADDNVRFDALFVDEAQDLSSLDRVLIVELARRAKIVTVVGDPRQAIFGFRGADSDAMGALRSALPNAHRCAALSRCYRCPHAVVAVANAAGAGEGTDPVQSVSPPRGDAVTARVWASEQEEMAWVVEELVSRGDPEHSCALVRLRRCAHALAIVCRSRGLRCLPWGAVAADGEDLFSRPAVAALRGVLTEQLAMGAAPVALRSHALRRLRAHGSPPRGEEAVLDAAIRFAHDLSGKGWPAAAEALRPEDEFASTCVNDTPVVRWSTVHGAKGLEFEHVVVTGLRDEEFPLNMTAATAEQLAEERRLFFVAVTRAKQTLALSCREPVSSFLREVCARADDVKWSTNRQLHGVSASALSPAGVRAATAHLERVRAGRRPFAAPSSAREMRAWLEGAAASLAQSIPSDLLANPTAEETDSSQAACFFAEANDPGLAPATLLDSWRGEARCAVQAAQDAVGGRPQEVHQLRSAAGRPIMVLGRRGTAVALVAHLGAAAHVAPGDVAAALDEAHHAAPNAAGCYFWNLCSGEVTREPPRSPVDAPGAASSS